MEVQELQFGHRRVCIYHLVKGTAPLVYSIDYHENGQLLLEACKQVACEGFNLVTISGLHWNQELSPWAVETVVSKDDRFTGGAPELLPLLTDEIVPQVEALLDAPPAWRCLPTASCRFRKRYAEDLPSAGGARRSRCTQPR